MTECIEFERKTMIKKVYILGENEGLDEIEKLVNEGYECIYLTKIKQKFVAVMEIKKVERL